MAEATVTNSAKNKVDGRPENGLRERSAQPFDSGPEARLLSLQRAIGNRSVGRLLQSMSSGTTLAADKAAPVVREALRSPVQHLSGHSAKLMSERFNRVLANEFSNEAHNGGNAGSNGHEQQARQVADLMSGPPDATKAEFTSFSKPQLWLPQPSFDNVRIHSGEQAAKAADSLHARAFTVGRDIVFGRNQFAPHTNEGQRLLAHEFTHVAQQANFAWPVIQCDDKKDSAKDAETVLGEKLWATFPNGVSVGFYDANLDEAKRRAADWAKQQNALGLKGTKIAADEIVFGKAIPDTLTVSSTLLALAKVLDAAIAKVPSPAGTAPAAGTGPTQVAVLGIFSHGTSTWCGIGGGLTDTSAAAVIKAIAPVVMPNLKVLLYSCSGARGPDEEEEWVKGTLQGGGEGSVASKVRDALVAEGKSEAEVWGHTTVGHVTENFALRFFTAASGKGGEGRAFTEFYIWSAFERVNFLFQLQKLVEDKGYVVDDKSSKKFFGKASNETNLLMYRCYGKANKDLTYSGQNLATMAPLHPQEVAKIVKDLWNKDYWTEDKKNALAEKLIKDAKLKKAAAKTP